MADYIDTDIVDTIATVNNFTSDTLVSLIKSHTSERNRTYGLWERFKGNVPIKKRQSTNYLKVNRKMAHDFRGQIVEQAVGYVFGNPITYTVVKENYTPAVYKTITNKIQSFNHFNVIDELDSTLGEYASVCGYAGRLLYFDLNGKLRVMNIKPWNTIFIYDIDIEEVKYGIIYDYFYEKIGANSVKRWKVEVYDDTNVTVFIEKSENNFILDPSLQQNPMPHGFNNVPLIKFQNNNLEKGDFENVETLIDVYDILNSDIQNETEEFRLAYLAFIGGKISEEELLKARKTGAFNLPNKDSDIKFITKQMEATLVEAHKKTIRENIYQFSSTVDFTDQAFSGNAESGEARKLRYQGLESKCIKKQRKFIHGLTQQYNLLAFIWNKINIKLNAEDTRFIFSRNLPIDLTYYATVSNKLYGQVSDKTRLSLMPFIKDADEEIAQMIAEKEQYGSLINLDNIIVTGSAA